MQIGSAKEPAHLMFAKFSPDGGRVAYVRDANIFVEDLDKETTNDLALLLGIGDVFQFGQETVGSIDDGQWDTGRAERFIDFLFPQSVTAGA